MRSATCVLAACLLTAGCAGTDRDVQPFRTPSLSGTGLEYYWEAPIPTDADETVRRLWRLDEMVYCLTDRRRLIAMDARTGLVRWSYRIEQAPEPIFRPYHPAEPVSLPIRSPGKREVRTFDAVMINTLSRLVILDRADGSEIRDLTLTFTASTGGAADGENFYAGAVSGRYHAFDYDVGVDTWVLSTGAIIQAPPELHARNLYVASEDDKLYATRRGLRPKKVWIATLGASVVAPFHVDNDGCYVAAEDGKIHAFDTFSGEPLWEPFACNARLTSPIQAGPRALFQHAENNVLFAVDARTGRLLWKAPGGLRVLANMDGKVYVLDVDRKLRVYSEELGELQASVPVTGLDVFLANTTAPAIYAATAGGKLFCIRPEGTDPLTPKTLAE
ncbi:MAG: PQQ-binding-like beta-propeller repeat protein [Planctomycetota bacterium]